MPFSEIEVLRSAFIEALIASISPFKRSISVCLAVISLRRFVIVVCNSSISVFLAAIDAFKPSIVVFNV